MGLTSASASASGRILSLSSPVTKTQFQKSCPFHKEQQNRLTHQQLRQKQQKSRKRKPSMKLRRQQFPAMSAKKTRQIEVLEFRKMHQFYSLVAKKNTNVDKVITTISIGGMAFPFPVIPQSQHCHSVAFGPNFVAIITKIVEGATKVMKRVADI